MGLQVEVVTPSAAVMSEEVSAITLPGEQGQFEVLPGHLPMLTIMKPGPMVVHREDGSTDTYAVGEGFVEVHPDHVIVLAEVAEGAFEIDIEEARRRAKEAEDRLAELGHEDSEERFSFQTALARSQSQIEVYESGKN